MSVVKEKDGEGKNHDADGGNRCASCDGERRWKSWYKTCRGDDIIASYVLNRDKAIADGWSADRGYFYPPASFKEVREHWAAFHVEFHGLKIPNWFLTYYPVSYSFSSSSSSSPSSPSSSSSAVQTADAVK
jgi:hypothetical protein